VGSRRRCSFLLAIDSQKLRRILSGEVDDSTISKRGNRGTGHPVHMENAVVREIGERNVNNSQIALVIGTETSASSSMGETSSI
jgi:hypothetical protein